MKLNTITQWAKAQLQEHPEWTSMMVGHGWDRSTDSDQAWLDITDQEGHHLAVEPGVFTPIPLPEDITREAIRTISIGQWVVFVPIRIGTW